MEHTGFSTVSATVGSGGGRWLFLLGCGPRRRLLWCHTTAGGRVVGRFGCPTQRNVRDGPGAEAMRRCGGRSAERRHRAPQTHSARRRRGFGFFTEIGPMMPARGARPPRPSVKGASGRSACLTVHRLSATRAQGYPLGVVSQPRRCSPRSKTTQRGRRPPNTHPAPPVPRGGATGEGERRRGTDDANGGEGKRRRAGRPADLRPSGRLQVF